MSFIPNTPIRHLRFSHAPLGNSLLELPRLLPIRSRGGGWRPLALPLPRIIHAWMTSNRQPAMSKHILRTTLISKFQWMRLHALTIEHMLPDGLRPFDRW